VKLSIITTVKNESKNIRNFIESALLQEPPWELIIVDAMSTDKTGEIIKEYANRYDNIKLIQKKCSRGEGRNIGVANSTSEYVIFTDGDVILDPLWLKYMREDFEKGEEVVAGNTILTGNKKFAELERVKLYYKNVDLTFPSCNLGYKKSLFLKIGGFDPVFITAEDIDLNFRAVAENKKLYYDERAIVYNKTRDNFISFYKQAFWNGYGRKQLTLKHGNLWKNYNMKNMFNNKSFRLVPLSRLGIAMLGYLYCKVKKGGFK
jgi:glycosyltransferase involved in cell wall biosynthesis